MDYNFYDLSEYLMITDKQGKLYGFSHSIFDSYSFRYMVFYEDSKWNWRITQGDNEVEYSKNSFDDTFSALKDVAMFINSNY